MTSKPHSAGADPAAPPSGATLVTVAPTGAEAGQAAAPALPVTLDELTQAVSALPDGATWSATGIGRTSVPVMFAALSAGGHLRVGMEDTLSYAVLRQGPPGHRQRRTRGAGGHARRSCPASPDPARPGARDAWGE
jgi:hypothetical protein